MPTWPERAAFIEECEAAQDTLAAAPADAGERPSLGEWPLSRLVGHLIGVTGRAGERVRAGAAGDRAEIDRVGYYRRHMALVADGSFEPAADPHLPDPASWPGAFAEAWQSCVAAVDDAGPDLVVDTRYGLMRVDEYLATRVLEVCVHHLDVRVALDLPPAPTVAAGRLTQALLEGMLDGPRPRNLGRTRFIRAATGRGGYDDPRFPVLR